MLNAIDLAGHFSEQYSESEKKFLTLRNIQVRKFVSTLICSELEVSHRVSFRF
jgi:hypothetical protein